MTVSNADFLAFLESYTETALWSSTYGDNGEHPMDDGAHDLAPATAEAFHNDCLAFLAVAGVEDAIDAAGPDLRPGRAGGYASAGHDFWLTRCRHGAGFWDGDWPEPHASTLDAASKAAGERSLYIGDDGMIYQG